jgi:hypothetical protein
MTEAQFVAIVVGFVITILASIGSMLTALLINNSHLTDLKGSVEARIAEAKDTLRSEIKAGDAAIISQMAIHQMDLISKIAELDHRITRLER